MNARDAALIELDDKALPNWPRQLVRSRRAPDAAPADPRDRALAEQITIGVVKNLLLLQHLISHHARRPLKGIDPLVQKILAIGLYQLRFLQRVPASATVDQAVRQAKWFGRTHAAGFVNAVLRHATRAPDPAPPDASSDPDGHARVALSHPAELFDRLKQTVGVEDALGIGRHDNREPPTILRLCDGIDVHQLHAPPDVTLTPHERAGMYVVEPARAPILAEWSRAGLAQVQDPTAAAVVPDFADVQPDQRVLDRCCGLGTKTMQLRERVGGGGLVIAVDPSQRRCETLRKLCAARGITNVGVTQTPLLAPVKRELPADLFERVLVDVPCSNSGVLPRRPEARYAQGDVALASLARLQREILDDTAPWVSPGGLLIYSTCSIWPEENQQRASEFRQSHPRFTFLRDRAVAPSFDTDDAARYHDGGYVAVFRRDA